MNRREFLHTVGGVAALGTLGSAPLESAAFRRQGDPRGGIRVVVLQEPGFPSIDGEPIALAHLSSGLRSFDAAAVGIRDLIRRLGDGTCDVLVTPYGSAFPRRLWPALLAYLERGGHWVNLGGVPLAVPVDGDAGSWSPGSRQTTFHRKLGITQAFPVDIPGQGETRSSDRHPWSVELVGQLPGRRAFAFYVRFASTKSFPDEDGSDGPREAVLDPLIQITNRPTPPGEGLVWPVAAPAVMVNRLSGPFAGGRWMFITSDGVPGAPAVSALVAAAAAGARRLDVRPRLAWFSPAERPTIVVSVAGTRGAQVRVETFDAAQARTGERTAALPSGATEAATIAEVAANGRGAFTVTAQIEAADPYGIERARTGFRVMEPSELQGGQPFGADAFSLRRKDQPFLVTGTTYMASDVHRQFLLEPDPNTWRRDFGQMKAAGVNLVRTGIWTGWSRYMEQPGRFNEAALRALDVFIQTATEHGIGVIFTFFAFMPPRWGGLNAYLDPKAVDAQKTFVRAIVQRYRSVQGLIWDLINEPSFCSEERLWTTRPNYDAFEQRAWAAWVEEPLHAAGEVTTRQAIEDRLRTLPDEARSLPPLEAFEDRNLLGDARALKVADYRRFAQARFRLWVEQLRDEIRAVAPPGQLVTVGQDEGGTVERPSNQFFGDAVDLTSIHTWWFNDDLLWDTVVSKHPSKPNLVQETGVMFYERHDGTPWRTEEEVRGLLERRLALAIAAGGAGYVNWIWNTNPYMPSDNEAAIGLLRADGTAKPEMEAWLGLTRFVREAAPHLDGRERERVLMVIPLAAQFGARSRTVEATRAAVRAMHYHCRVEMAAAGEYALDAWPERPALVVVPSPRLLTEHAWTTITLWVHAGAVALVTGPFDDDDTWTPTGRMAELGLPAAVRPVMGEEVLAVGGATYRFAFRGEALQRVETTALPAGSPSALARVPFGRGQVLWTPMPIELSQSPDGIPVVYREALAAARVEPIVSTDAGPGTLVYAARYRASTLYAILSETAEERPVRIGPTNGEAPFDAAPARGRAVLVLTEKGTGRILGSYGRVSRQ